MLSALEYGHIGLHGAEMRPPNPFQRIKWKDFLRREPPGSAKEGKDKKWRRMLQNRAREKCHNRKKYFISFFNVNCETGSNEKQG